MWSLYIHGHFMPMGDLDLDLWGQILDFAFWGCPNAVFGQFLHREG